ncbi:MAG: DUF1499 domain-containing protein [Desulfobacterales bacterium]
MKNFTRFYIVLLGLAAFTNGCSGIKSDKAEFGDQALADCPDRPNCVSSKARDKGHAVEPFYIKGDPIKVWNAVTAIITGFPRTTIVKATDRYLHAECKSRLFGFTDDLELLLEPSANVIEIRSASRTGYYDFGVNRRRVSRLRTILQDKDLIY